MARIGRRFWTVYSFIERGVLSAAVRSTIAAVFAASACSAHTATPVVSPTPSRPGAEEPPAPAAAPTTQVSASGQERIVDASIDRVAVPSGGPSRGPANAKVTIIVFNSYEGSWGRRVDLELDQLAREYPDDLRTCFRHFPNRGLTPDELQDPEVKAAIARGTYWEKRYSLFQMAAQAAVALVDGEPAGNLTREHIVDNIRLYWLTRTRTPAARSYWEDGLALARALASGKAPPALSLPVGFTTFPGEIWRSPRSWVAASYPNVTYFNEVDRGATSPRGRSRNS
jgi:hypothetical protein